MSRRPRRKHAPGFKAKVALSGALILVRSSHLRFAQGAEITLIDVEANSHAAVTRRNAWCVRTSIAPAREKMRRQL